MNTTPTAQSALARRLVSLLSEAAVALQEYATTVDAAKEHDAASGTDAAPELPTARGPRQQEIVDVLLKSEDEDGIKTGEIADRISMDSANAYLTLQALQKQEIVEMVPGAHPQRWRLVPRYRLSRRIVEVANLVERGEWTGYGEISQVVYGHAMAGPAVGVVVSRLSDVVNPHRVLRHDGEISEDWVDSEGRRRDECRRRLIDEGVDVDVHFYAHGRFKIDAEELSRRLKARRA
jgi:alkylated DNA nucleotide flippase Atl1